MNKSLILAFLFLLPFITVEAREHKPYEMRGTRIVPIQDSESGRKYALYIKLPETYLENNDTDYPVIYFTDAVWHIEILSASTSYLMENAILVGISWQEDINEDLKKEFGAHASRFRDYSIRKSGNPEIQAKHQMGQAANHLDFIRNDVFTYVESHYRADSGRRTYFGYSLGGKFGAYILLAQPDTFENYILGSPSFEGESDIQYLSELDSNATPKPKGLNTNVFVSYGSLETELGMHAEEFITMLKARNDDSLALTHVVIEGNHQAALPLTGVRSVTWLSNLTRDEESRKSQSQDGEPLLEGPYLGQAPPGVIPEAFAPGIVTTEDYEYGGIFSPDMKAFYIIREKDKNREFVVFQYKNNRWHELVISPAVGQPFIAPDGNTMHLGKQYKERTDTGWSELKRLGSPFEEIGIMRLTTSSKGTYVFDEAGTDGDGIIRYSRLVDGKREEPRPFGKEINAGTWNAHPFIAPDESYLLWDGKRDGGFGDSDIYISFRQQDGSWGNAINLGDKINTDAWEASASVTPDGKYLFFHRKISPGNADKLPNLDIYWVDAQFIESLRPTQ